MVEVPAAMAEAEVVVTNQAKDAAFLLTLPDVDLDELTNHDRQIWGAALAWYSRYIERDPEILSGKELTKIKPETIAKVYRALKEAKK